MNATLTRAALDLQPRERLELAQLLITSVQDNLDTPVILDLNEAERLDLENRILAAYEQPLAGADKTTFLKALEAKRLAKI